MANRNRDTITRIHGNKVTIELEDWRRFLGYFRACVLELEGMVPDIGPRASAGGCDDCEGKCAGHGGCDFAFGDPPDCGYVCEDGHIVLDDEV